MLTTKYSPLPRSDPDSGSDESSIQFESAFKFHDPQESRKYRSAFVYSDYNPNDIKSKEDIPDQSLGFKLCSALVTLVCYILWFITLPISGWWTFKMINQHERIVVFRLGKLKEAKGPGLVIVLPCIDRLTRVDLRMRAFSVPPQNLLTADGGGIEVGAEVFFRIKDPIASVANVQDMNHSSRIISQTALARAVTSHDLSDLELKKQEICDTIQRDINKLTLTWGVEVSKIQLSEVKVIQEPNPIMMGCNNPLNILNQVLCAPGSHLPSTMAPFASLLANQSQAPAVLPLKTDTSSATAEHTEIHSVEKLIESIRPHLTETLVKDVGFVYRFVEEGNGDDKRVFYLDLKHGTGDIGEGEPPYGDWDATLTLTVDLLMRLLRQELTPLAAYMRGELLVDGDLRAASQLGQVTERINM